MCGIYVSAVCLVERQPPVPLVLIPEFVKIVDITALHMFDFPEKAMLCHVQGSEFEKVIDAVLKHHAVSLRLLCYIHELPAFGNRCRCRYFYGYMLAVLHRVYGHRNVQLPSCADVYEVDVIPLAQFFPSFFPAVSGSFRESSVRQYFLG